jgi:integrase
MTLFAAQINAFSCPEGKKQIKKYDSKGLYLLVKVGGSKLWRFRYKYGSKNKEMALGSYPSVSLSKARDLSGNSRVLLGQGIDPMEERKANKQDSRFNDKAFGNVAVSWWEKQRSSWEQEHAVKVKRWLTEDAKSLVKLPVDKIDAGHITDLMLEIEASGSAKKAPVILSLINRVFAYALAHRLTRDNPAQGLSLRDIIGPLPKVKSFAAITNPEALGKLILDIDTAPSGSYCTIEALKLIPRIFLRTSEVRNLKWDYIDFKEKLIRIPDGDMKSSREHLVPISIQTITQLKEIQIVTGYSPYVFPGQRTSDKPISKNVMTNRLRGMGYPGDVMTTHGFRSTASTILHEKSWEHDVIEVQLAHLTGTATSRAYNRALHLPKRKKMMQAWADYLDEIKSKAASAK